MPVKLQPINKPSRQYAYEPNIASRALLPRHPQLDRA